MAYLLRLWKVIVRRIKKTSGPVDIYEESDMITRTIRDIFTGDVDTIYIDEPKAYERAARVADGFLFGTSGAAAMTERTPAIREAFAAAGKPDATVAGLAYVALGENPRKALDEATHNVLRYYGRLWTEPEHLIHHGPASKIAEELAAYADGGVDVLVAFPQIASLDQVEQLAEHVLPAHSRSALAA